MATTPIVIKSTAPVTPAPAPAVQQPAPVLAVPEPTAPVQEVVQAVADGTQEEVVVEEHAAPAQDLQTLTHIAGDIGVELPADIQALIGQMVTTYGEWTKAQLQSIAEYIDTMAPNKPVESASKGVQAQTALWANIETILRCDQPHYTLLVSSLLGIMHTYKSGVFGDAHVFRFYEYMPGNAAKRDRMRLVITLLKELADPQTRMDIAKQINVELAMSGFGDGPKARMTNYLQLG
jgi:hypothetical protein